MSYITGKCTFYGRGLMEKVAMKRGVKLDGATGYCTYPNCEFIGKTIMVSVLNPVSGKWSGWERKRIVDCSQPKDRARHEAEHLVELSYSDAVKYNYAREGRTKVRFYKP